MRCEEEISLPGESTRCPVRLQIIMMDGNNPFGDLSTKKRQRWVATGWRPLTDLTVSRVHKESQSDIFIDVRLGLSASKYVLYICM